MTPHQYTEYLNVVFVYLFSSLIDGLSKKSFLEVLGETGKYVNFIWGRNSLIEKYYWSLLVT